MSRTRASSCAARGGPAAGGTTRSCKRLRVMGCRGAPARRKRAPLHVRRQPRGCGRVVGRGALWAGWDATWDGGLVAGGGRPLGGWAAVRVSEGREGMTAAAAAAPWAAPHHWRRRWHRRRQRCRVDPGGAGAWKAGKSRPGNPGGPNVPQGARGHGRSTSGAARRRAARTCPPLARRWAAWGRMNRRRWRPPRRPLRRRRLGPRRRRRHAPRPGLCVSGWQCTRTRPAAGSPGGRRPRTTRSRPSRRLLDFGCAQVVGRLRKRRGARGVRAPAAIRCAGLANLRAICRLLRGCSWLSGRSHVTFRPKYCDWSAFDGYPRRGVRSRTRMITGHTRLHGTKKQSECQNTIVRRVRGVCNQRLTLDGRTVRSA